MKTFTLIYVKTVQQDAVIQAKNEKEARQKFQAAHPEIRVIDIHEWDESMGYE